MEEEGDCDVGRHKNGHSWGFLELASLKKKKRQNVVVVKYCDTIYGGVHFFFLLFLLLAWWWWWKAWDWSLMVRVLMEWSSKYILMPFLAEFTFFNYLLGGVAG